MIKLFFIGVLFLLNQPEYTEKEINKPYLDQKTPGLIPEVFAPGIISTRSTEFGIAFSPSGDEIYFGRQSGSSPTAIYVTKNVEGEWTEAEKLPFSGNDFDMDPFLSCDGTKLFFGSMRSNGNPYARGCDIWYAEKTEDGSWSEVINAGELINTNDNENHPSVACNGNLYFHSKKHKGKGGLDIFKSEFNDGNYSEPENLGDAINSRGNESDVFVAGDESYLIFSSDDRSEGYGSGDLYISFQDENGNWSEAVNMGQDINSEEMEYCPKVSPDGKYLFFSSYRDDTANIYWVDAKIIDIIAEQNR